jgi:hypothetical protein
VTVTTVAAAPGEPPTGGEPLVGFRVTEGRTVKVAEAESPFAPVIVTVYTSPGAVFETMKWVLTSEPVESIEQEDEANNPVGDDTNELHVPTSRVENAVDVVAVTEVPAIPLVGDNVNVGATATVKPVVSA